MTSRSTQIGLGLAIAVIVVIVSALFRFRVSSPQQLRSNEADQRRGSPEPSTLDARTVAPSTPPAQDEEVPSAEGALAVISESKTADGSVTRPSITLHGVVSEVGGAPIHMDELLCGTDRVPGSSAARFVGLQGDQGKRRGSIDDDGHYSLKSVMPGKWRLFVRLAGYRPWETELELSEIDHDRRLDIALEPYAVLRVRIVIELDDPSFDPHAVHRLAELAGDTDLTSTVRTAVTRVDDEGSGLERDLTGARRAKEESGGPGAWIVRESIELRTPLPILAAVVVGDRVLQSRRVDSTTEEVAFALTLAEVRSSLGSIRFHLIDERGREPTRRCTCLLSRLDQWERTRSGYGPSDYDWEPTASHLGDVRLRGLHPGPLGIQVLLPEYSRIQLETAVEPGVERDLGEFRLQRAVTIRGRVLNSDGTPAQAEVEYSPVPEAQSAPSPFTDRCETDSPGGFMIYDAARGKYLLRAYSRGDRQAASKPMVVSTEGGSVDGVLMTLVQTTQVSVRLENPPRAVVTLRIEDVQGLIVEQEVAHPTEKGVREAFFLTPGQYTARALAKGQEIATSDFVVSSDPVRVVLTPR